MSTRETETPYDIKALKAGGLMKQKERDLFSIRLRVIGGRMTAAQLVRLASIAEEYGRGHIHLTTRQGVEIPHVRFRDIEKVRSDLAEAELEFGACGPRVRTITACQGGSCSHGLIDSQALAEAIDAEFFGIGGLPHKFKIGITGCPNACIKPLENDLGIMGIVLKRFIEERCNLCGLCVHACPIPGTLELESERLLYRAVTCVHCGSCVAACPTDAWEKTGAGYAVFVGGKMGKRPRLGSLLTDRITDERELLDTIHKVLSWYAENGNPGERFGETIDRVGLEDLQASALP